MLETHIVTAEQLVEHFNKFQRRKTKKRDFTLENLFSLCNWPMRSLVLRGIDQETRDKQQEETYKAVDILLKETQ